MSSSKKRTKTQIDCTVTERTSLRFVKVFCARGVNKVLCRALSGSLKQALNLYNHLSNGHLYAMAEAEFLPQFDLDD